MRFVGLLRAKAQTVVGVELEIKPVKDERRTTTLTTVVVTTQGHTDGSKWHCSY